jgi:hypothetical protein
MGFAGQQKGFFFKRICEEMQLLLQAFPLAENKSCQWKVQNLVLCACIKKQESLKPCFTKCHLCRNRRKDKNTFSQL